MLPAVSLISTILTISLCSFAIWKIQNGAQVDENNNTTDKCLNNVFANQQMSSTETQQNSNHVQHIGRSHDQFSNKQSHHRQYKDQRNVKGGREAQQYANSYHSQTKNDQDVGKPLYGEDTIGGADSESLNSSNENNWLNDSHTHFDPLDSHSGIFRALNWSDEELRQVSRHHALAEYEQLIRMVKGKLSTAKQMNNDDHRLINSFLRRHKPPKILSKLLNSEDKKLIIRYYEAGAIGDAMDVLLRRLNQLSTKQRAIALAYFDVTPPP